MSDEKLSEQVLLVLGNIQGELRGIRETVQTGQAATNQRIDDLKTAVTDRIDGLEGRVARLENDHGKLMVKTASYGGLAGGAMTALVELLRYMGKGG